MSEQQKPIRVSQPQQKALLRLRNGPVSQAEINTMQVNTYEALVRKGLAEKDGMYYRAL
ncbi:MAG: hypothetical protein HOI61_08005 [Gammaproteobacteria bacterium]|nr:hypothetical protein [Gammaproteobacteria bacterium]MBT3488659.1 hypothetical protein [Gammaproteobacteria bacterium]MBT3718279.1 hypothetical protein [Gammaproteobacteria bacterium]MBT3844710.1 hypothetical protein [Gammaproteobacteria bacterium]MBT3892720.1 hypothetical protein [Gammaproteobacteria bacterium]